MAHRCPDSQVAGKAELSGYRLLHLGRPGQRPRRRTVPVLLWKVSVRDEACWTGMRGYLYYYGKVQIPVELWDGKPVSATAYVMQHLTFKCAVPSYPTTIRVVPGFWL